MSSKRSRSKALIDEALVEETLHVGAELREFQVSPGWCSGLPAGSVIGGHSPEPGYMIVDRSDTEEERALILCRACAVKLAVAILEREVG